MKLVTFQVLLPTLDTPPKRFSVPRTRPATCFAGRREGPVLNFLLPPLPSEIGDLLVRISTSGTRKSPQGPNLGVGRLGYNRRLMLRQNFIEKE